MEAQPSAPELEPAGVLEQCDRIAQRIRAALGDQLRSAHHDKCCSARMHPAPWARELCVCNGSARIAGLGDLRVPCAGCNAAGSQAEAQGDLAVVDLELLAAACGGLSGTLKPYQVCVNINPLAKSQRMPVRLQTVLNNFGLFC